MGESNSERPDFTSLAIIWMLGAPVLALIQLSNPIPYGWIIVAVYGTVSALRLYLLVRGRQRSARSVSNGNTS